MRYLLLMVIILFVTSCTAPPMSHEPKDTAPYTIKQLSIPYPKPSQTPWYTDDKIYVSENGSIQVALSQMTSQAQTYYFYQIYTSEGKRVQLYNCDTFPIAWETYTGLWIVSTGKMTGLYDKNWQLLETLDNPMYAGYPLDNGRYYAVNDTYKQEYGFAVGVDGENNPELYALYRCTERLTDCLFTHIEPVDGGFRCYTDDKQTEYVVYPAEDIAATPKETFFVHQEQRTGLYTYVDAAGMSILDKKFTHAFPPGENGAVAWIYDRAYLIAAP